VIADDPSAKQTVPITDVIAPASINDFNVSRHTCGQAGKFAVAKNLPVHSELSDIAVASRAIGSINDRSDIAALDLLGQGFDQFRHFFKVRIDGERLPEGVERAPFVADILHDHAEPRQRAKMARFADQYLLDVFERMGIIVLQII
jgi:hypothetical protein